MGLLGGWVGSAWWMQCCQPSGPSLQGVIAVKGLVDREKGDFYTLTVVADDGGPKVDSTVVSRSPGKNPTGSLITTQSHLQTHIFTSHPKC